MSATYNCVTRATVKVRPEPNTANTTNITMPIGTSFQISAIVPDSLDLPNPAKKWGKIFGGAYNGMYTALEYPNNISPISTYTPIVDAPEPPNSEVYLTHTIEVFSDGSVKVDGNFI